MLTQPLTSLFRLLQRYPLVPKEIFFFFLLDVCRSIHLHTNSKSITVEIQSLNCNNDTKKQQELSSSCIVSKSPCREFMSLELSSCFGNTMAGSQFFKRVFVFFFFLYVLFFVFLFSFSPYWFTSDLESADDQITLRSQFHSMYKHI